jgi:multiple sugar transport system permease protein
MHFRRRSGESPWTYIQLLLILVPFLFPLFWMFLSSFKMQVENTAYPPVWIFTPTLDNYREVFIKNPFFQFTWNSMVVAAGSTGLGLLLGLPGSYAIARFKRTGIALAILTARMAPGIAYLIPWFILFTKLKMIDTYTALILTHLIVVLPLVLWVMIGFFEDVPSELIEAARIDGCSNFSAFLRVALPLVKPGIVATAILSFIFSWNNFLFSLIIAGFKTRTLPIAVYNFLSYEEINWGGLTAAATIITLPVLVLALFIQKHIVRGLTFGALKG